MSPVVFGDALVPVLQCTAGRCSTRPVAPLCGEPCSRVGLLFEEGHSGSFQKTVQLKGWGRCTRFRPNRCLNDNGKWMGAGRACGGTAVGERGRCAQRNRCDRGEPSRVTRRSFEPVPDPAECSAR